MLAERRGAGRELLAALFDGSAQPSGGPRRAGRLAAVLAAWAVLGAWGGYWAFSIKQDKLAKPHWTWLNSLDYLGGDFLANYQAAHARWAGIDPYHEPYGDPYGFSYDYAPVVIQLFSWTLLFKPRTATVVWIAALAAVAAAGAAASWRTRRSLDLPDLPLPVVLAAVLASTPVLLEMERGNCNMLVLLPVLLAVAALRRRTPAGDLIGGAALALAAWVKPYASLAAPGLLATRRSRAAVALGVGYVALGLADLDGTRSFLATAWSESVDYYTPFHPAAHPLSTHWKHLWEGTILSPLAQVPGVAGAAAVLLPPAVWVSYRFYRAREPRLLYPYLVWLIALVTFLPRFANDYNLFFLPLAALAVWDRRDGPLTHLALALLFLWWQPIRLPIAAKLLFVFKLLGLMTVGLILLRRLREVPPDADGPRPADPASAAPISERPARSRLAATAAASIVVCLCSGALTLGGLLRDARRAPLPDLSWRGGFSTLETSASLDWRWCSEQGQLHVTNWSRGVQRVRIDMTLVPAQAAPAALRIESPFFDADLTITPEGTPLSKVLTVLPGRHVIHFACDGQVVHARGDLRPLVFKVLNFRIAPLGPAGRDQRAVSREGDPRSRVTSGSGSLRGSERKYSTMGWSSVRTGPEPR